MIEGDTNIIKLKATNFENKEIKDFKIAGDHASNFVIGEENQLKFADESFTDLRDSYFITLIAFDLDNDLSIKNPVTIQTHRKDEPERKFFIYF